jgi:hypothetical protein
LRRDDAGTGRLRRDAALRADTETAAIPFIFLTKGEKPDTRSVKNLGADNCLTGPSRNLIYVRPSARGLERAVKQAVPESKPNFESAEPLKEVFGLTPRVA